MIYFLLSFLLIGDTTALYHSLEPTSVTEHLAFYELHKGTKMGRDALDEAARLLHTESTPLEPLAKAFLELTHPTKKEIPESTLTPIQKMGKSLGNRALLGHTIKTLDELVKLPSHEIDLARALLIIEGEASRNYEAMLDVCALQIQARLPENPTLEEQIEAINRLIFFDLGIRFPPHSLSEKSIDTYTLLPSVLDSRRGVCLGVSTLFLALAERLHVPLEIITPPGHIYLAAAGINIETTARGVNVPSYHYLGLNLKSQRRREKREVLGMVLMNQGSKYLCDNDAQKAEAAYEKALLFMPEDPYLKTFYACSLLLQEKDAKAMKLLQSVPKDPHVISQDVLVEDLKKGRASKESLSALFIVTDHTRKSQLLKRKELEEACRRDPKFQSAWLHLAGTYIELQKFDLAIEALEKSVKMSPDITSEYLLATLYHERFQDKKARLHLAKAIEIAKAASAMPESLEELKRTLGS